MFQITSKIYNRLALDIQDHISPHTIFSGVIEFDCDDVSIRFVATIIPYYLRESFPEGDVVILDDIVPVWWELRSTSEDVELLNDFDFETLKFLICQH